MNDTYVKTEHHSLGGCLKDSFKGILFGVILFLSAFPLLFWNEGRAVKTAQALDEGAGAVVSVASDNINRANEGKLVHMTGLATTDETLADQVFGVSFKGIKLSRSVSMYQWVEGQETRTEKKLGGGEERVTTYTYQKEWSMFLNNSSRFAQPDGHANPSSFPYESKTFYADKVSVGNFLLSPSQTGRIGGGRTLPVNKDFLQSAAPSIRDQLQINGGQFATGKANDPRIGDLRISFSGIEPTTVSLVSTQQGDTFVPYVAKSGYQVDMLRTGSITAEAMFEKAMADNTFFTWVLRAVGLMMMWIGMSAIAKPLVVVADIIPFVGNIVGMGTSFFAFIIAVPSALMTIAVAWIFYRPLLGIALITAGVGIFVWGFRKATKQDGIDTTQFENTPPIPE